MKQAGMNEPGPDQPGMNQPGMAQPSGMSPSGTPQPHHDRSTTPSKPQPDISASPGGIAASGLAELLDRLREAGFDDQVNSWLSDGPNKSIDAREITRAIGPGRMAQLAEHAGVPPDEIAVGLAKVLPAVVDRMTPNGRVPSAFEMEGTMNRLFG
jgi:uncharacterized protein YidB (DUF937 family)